MWAIILGVGHINLGVGPVGCFFFNLDMSSCDMCMFHRKFKSVDCIINEMRELWCVRFKVYLLIDFLNCNFVTRTSKRWEKVLLVSKPRK